MNRNQDFFWASSPAARAAERARKEAILAAHKAYSISGGTGIDRLNKANELIGQFFNKGDEVLFERCMNACMLNAYLKAGKTISETDDVKIEDPVIFMIEPKNCVDDDGLRRCPINGIEKLAIQQGNVIDLNVTASLSCGQ